ncbi:MAG: hypothetical protein HY537_07940 [Deltaproteobacteria bacterium]|nr:hypothetical protein [Deltaproteobacteria bacterium]
MAYSFDDICDTICRHPRLIIAEDYELCIQRTQSKNAQFINGNAVHEAIEDSVWVSLRLLHRRQPGRSVVVGNTKQSLHSLVDSAFESARKSSPDPWFRFPLWRFSKQKNPLVMTFEPIQDSAPQWKSQYSDVAGWPDLFKEEYRWQQFHTQLVRKGERIQPKHKSSTLRTHYSLLSHQDSDYFWVNESRSFSKLADQEDFKASTLAQKAKQLTGKGVKPQNNSYKWLLSSQACSMLLGEMTDWFCADSIHSGRSPLGRVPKLPCFSSDLTLVDDGAYEGAAHSAPFDLEGVLTQKTTVISSGRLESSLYDNYSATRENRLSTGNFLRAPGAPFPKISATNFFIQPSNRSAESLLQDLGQGLGQGLLISTVEKVELLSENGCDCLVKAHGWIVSRGCLASPFVNLSFKINALDLLGRVLAVGSDFVFYGACGAPSILIDDLPLESIR